MSARTAPDAHLTGDEIRLLLVALDSAAGDLDARVGLSPGGTLGDLLRDWRALHDKLERKLWRL